MVTLSLLRTASSFVASLVRYGNSLVHVDVIAGGVDPTASGEYL